MIQAYYTKYQTAKLIERILYHTNNFPSRALPTLDLCSGLGALSAPYVSSLTELHMVEMNEEALLDALEDLDQAKGWALMAEEWALTYAKAKAYGTTLCNPPFGKRAGRTKLDELGVELHWPELAYSETYFLRLAAAVTKTRLVFILPASALKDTPETRLVLSELETRGFCPTHVYELPVDGFEGATVKTHLWIFERTKVPYQWVDAICAMPRDGFPAPVQAPRHTFSHPYGPIEGYALKEGSTAPLTLKPLRFEEAAGPLDDSTLWAPCPKPLGSLWTRMECVYELTEQGWTPAQSQGYREGQAIDETFERALRAAEYMRQGAIYMAQHVANGLDTEALLERFGHLPQAGLLAYLPQGRRCPHAMSKDLKQLGLLELLDPQDAQDQVIEGAWRLKRNRYLDQDAPVGLLAQLSLEQEPLSPEHHKRLELALETLQIPTSRLELRASWIPKALICEYLRKDLHINQDGLYDRRPYPHIVSDGDHVRLIGWLNYNKGPRRILEGDEALYHRKSAQFAVFVQQETERDELRRAIKLHWLAQYTPKRHIHLKREAQPSLIPLHPWQLEDQAFATSDQAFLNWDVGLGKTLGAISAAIQAHPGQAVFVVPKSVLDKWAREIHLAFPQTTVARIGMRQTRNATWVNDYKLMPEQLIEACYRKPVKCLLMTHEAWARLSISPRHQRRLDADEASRLHQGSSKRETYTRELHLVRAAERNYLFGGVFNFEDLPLAQWLVVIDEAHQFKSLHAMPSGGWGSGLIRVGHCSESKRARDMHHKLKLLREQGGKSLGLSATPVTNSVVEIFNMLSIFAPDVLEARGLENPQQFIDTYCELEELTTVSLAGAPISGQTIVGFRNLDDLEAMFAQCMSTRTAQDVGLELPQACEQFVKIKPTPKILAFIREQQSLLDDKILGQDQGIHEEVHVFSIISAIDDVAAHPPLRAITEEHPKLEALLERVAQHQAQGGQLIFADRTESHEPLAQALVTRLGLKREQIAILNGQTTSTSAARLKVQDAYNAGKLKVIIGGKMMSEGMDLQYDTCAIHFMNLSWEDNTIHQRKGRGVRQGNTQDEVQIYYYILEGSTDVYRQGTCTQKAGWFSALRSTQSEHMRLSLFDDPIEPELIASLSAKPDEVLVQLREAKAMATLSRLQDKVNRLSIQIILRLHPQTRATQQPMLAQFERQLRQLPSLHDEDIDRVIQGIEMVVAPYRAYRHNADRWRDMWLASKKEDRPQLNLKDLIELVWDEQEHRPKFVAKEAISLQGPTTWITPGLTTTAEVVSKPQARPFELVVISTDSAAQGKTPVVRPKPQLDVWSLSANTPVERIEGTQLDLFAS